MKPSAKHGDTAVITAWSQYDSSQSPTGSQPVHSKSQQKKNITKQQRDDGRFGNVVTFCAESGGVIFLRLPFSRCALLCSVVLPRVVSKSSCSLISRSTSAQGRSTFYRKEQPTTVARR